MFVDYVVLWLVLVAMYRCSTRHLCAHAADVLLLVVVYWDRERGDTFLVRNTHSRGPAVPFRWRCVVSGERRTLCRSSESEWRNRCNTMTGGPKASINTNMQNVVLSGLCNLLTWRKCDIFVNDNLEPFQTFVMDVDGHLQCFKIQNISKSLIQEFLKATLHSHKILLFAMKHRDGLN